MTMTRLSSYGNGHGHSIRIRRSTPLSSRQQQNTHPWRNGHFPDVEVGGHVMLSSEEHLLVLDVSVTATEALGNMMLLLL